MATASYQRQSHICCQNERVSVGKVLSEWVLVCFRVLQKMITHLTIISGWFTIIIDKKHSLIIIVPLRIKKLWGFQASPSKLLYITIVIIITIVNMTAWCHSIFFECQLGTLFLNHLSYVEQGTQKYVICSRFSILHVNTNLLQH